jgi:hypothetical protein
LKKRKKKSGEKEVISEVPKKVSELEEVLEIDVFPK